MTCLSDLPVGARARVVQIGGERSFRRRLMELGLLPGTNVRMVRKADIGGILEVECRGCHLSLRHSEARNLFLQLS